MEKFLLFNLLQIKYVQEHVILSALTPEMWTSEQYSYIEEFFNSRNPFRLLVIYVDTQIGLVLDNKIPAQAVDEICYFIRKEGMAIDSSNIDKEVQYGSVKSGHIESLLRLMQSIYAPLFFENTSWPDSIHFN